MQDDPELRRVLWFLLGGRRGGENRARIIRCIRERPRNLNQLANDLRLQYKAVQHHMRILVSNSLVVPSGEGYGTVYMPSPWFEHHFEMFEQICAKLGLGPSPSSKQDQVSGLATEGPDQRETRSGPQPLTDSSTSNILGEVNA